MTMKAGCDKCERVFWKLLEDEPCPWCEVERLTVGLEQATNLLQLALGRDETQLARALDVCHRDLQRLKAENYVITITEQQITSPSHNDDEYDVAAGGDKC